MAEIVEIAEDGNFKRGRFKPIAVIVGILAIGLTAGLLWFGYKTDVEQLTVEQVMQEKKNIFVLPKDEQMPRWRQWAGSAANENLQSEALVQLAWAEDPQGVELAVKAVQKPNHNVRGVAAQCLAYYGSPRGDAGKPVLLKALEEADESDRPQIIWALIELGESQVFDRAMVDYRAGHLAKVKRLGGGSAFDAAKLAGLVSLDQLATMASDESGAVRQLVATVLSKNAEPKWTDTLTKLVTDKDVEVAREAASGLGKIGDEKARGPLLQALKIADTDSRQKFLEALRDGIGGEGLVLALDSVSRDNEERAWFQTKQIFGMLEKLADPRIGDAMLTWVDAGKPHAHWRTMGGTRMAEVGDVRAAKLLGERMLLDPTVLYKKEKFWEADAGGHMSRTDRPRVVASRMLADLAAMHPDKAAEIREAAEAQVIKWSTDKPQPHANGLRFLASVQSEEILPMMRDWAFPDEPLPKEGAQPPFPMAYETAQSALRYIGKMKDKESFDKLLMQLERKKDKKMDITQAGLEGAGLAMLGMALRAVAYGSSQGLGEWGDPKAAEKLQEFIEDETWHEEARGAACEALAWCAEGETMVEIAKKAAEFAGKEKPREQLIGACYATTLSLSGAPEAVKPLVDLLTRDLDVGVAVVVAQAIGISGFDKETEAKLFEKMKDIEIRAPAALALILGGSDATAARTVAMYAEFSKEELDVVKDHYYRAFGYWSDEDFQRGNLYRYVRNAEAISRVKIDDVPQVWARQRLQSQFNNLQFDNGPHSETRVVLRYRLYDQAKNGDDEQKKGATQTLRFMKEQGVLMALRHEDGLTGKLASRAFHELMNPALVQAEDLSKLKAEQVEKNQK